MYLERSFTLHVLLHKKKTNYCSLNDVNLNTVEKLVKQSMTLMDWRPDRSARRCWRSVRPPLSVPPCTAALQTSFMSWQYGRNSGISNNIMMSFVCSISLLAASTKRTAPEREHDSSNQHAIDEHILALWLHLPYAVWLHRSSLWVHGVQRVHRSQSCSLTAG